MSVEVEDVSIAALLHQLGGIHPRRVRRYPFPGTATEADALAAECEPRKALCELIDGTLVEKPMGAEESSIAARIIQWLLNYVDVHDPNCLVLAPDGFMRIAPGNVRIPDVSYTSSANMESVERFTPIADFAPDFAVEVLSKSNTRKEMTRKRHEYFAAGTSLVWEVNPRTRTVDVYTDPTRSTRLTDGDTVTGGDALPGFSMPVTKVLGRRS